MKLFTFLLILLGIGYRIYAMEPENLENFSIAGSPCKITFFNENKQDMFIVEKNNNMIVFVNEMKSFAQAVLDDRQTDDQTKQNAEKILANICNVTHQIKSPQILIFPENDRVRESCSSCLSNRRLMEQNDAYQSCKKNVTSAENILGLSHAYALIREIEKNNNSMIGCIDISGKVKEIKELTDIVLKDKNEFDENKQQAKDILKKLYAIAPEKCQAHIKKSNQKLKGLHKLMNSPDKRIEQAARLLSECDMFDSEKDGYYLYSHHTISGNLNEIKQLICQIVVDKGVTDEIREEAKEILKRMHEINKIQKAKKKKIQQRECGECGSYGRYEKEREIYDK